MATLVEIVLYCMDFGHVFFILREILNSSRFSSNGSFILLLLNILSIDLHFYIFSPKGEKKKSQFLKNVSLRKD